MVIIVPGLPPNIDGLGDYAYLLANQFRKNGEKLKIDFVVAGKSAYPYNEYDGYNIFTLKKKTASDLCQLLQQLDSKLVHLHYVSYGYAKRGAPLWLYMGLKKWKGNRENVLITTFHELYAPSKRPWTSSFWNQWLQKLICKKLLVLTEHSVTSKEAYGYKLKKFCSTKKITTIPVFSNLGELITYIPLSEKKMQLVILGAAVNRNKIYNSYRQKINEVCKNLNIEKVIDIGPSFGRIPELNIPVIEMGIMNRSDISDILGQSYAGLIGSYGGTEYFAKSGVFAAYTAHAVLVVALEADSSKQEDGIIVNQILIAADFVEGNYNRISWSGYEWYMQHSLQKQWVVYKEIFEPYN